MNRRTKKKAEKRMRAKVHKVVDLVLDINGLCPRRRSETGDKPTAFMCFSGHVAGISVDICKNGWSDDIEKYDMSVNVYLDNENAKCMNDMIRHLEEFKNELEI